MIPDNYLFNPDGSVAKHFTGMTREEALRPLIQEALSKRVNSNQKTTNNQSK